ncbi:hypothetical protein [Cupriavidus malaysiensis]|nr:hypothetical protein [Cupriavidus malaysiensis]
MWEPLFGELSVTHVQLAPQIRTVLDLEVADKLKLDHPNTRFRLHANVRVTEKFTLADLAGFERHMDWFKAAADVSRALGATAYTAHAGRRAEASLARALRYARQCADLFGCPVGIEGGYPDRAGAQLVSSWAEYRAVFESGVPYAIDLSHVHILSEASGERQETLLAEMLACERCIEVHVSDNDGLRDTHEICAEPPWWHSSLDHVNASAIVFSEGRHRGRTTGEYVPRQRT